MVFYVFVPFMVKFKVLSLACMLGSPPDTCNDSPSRTAYAWRIDDSSEGHQGLLSQIFLPLSVCVCVCACVCVCLGDGRALVLGSQKEEPLYDLVWLENSLCSDVSGPSTLYPKILNSFPISIICVPMANIDDLSLCSFPLNWLVSHKFQHGLPFSFYW